MVEIKDVEHIAKLAKIKLEPGEAQEYSQQLSKILDYVHQLEKVDTEGVEPVLTASPIENIYRKDEQIKNLDIEEKLKNAPEKSGHLVKVPPVVG